MCIEKINMHFKLSRLRQILVNGTRKYLIQWLQLKIFLFILQICFIWNKYKNYELFFLTRLIM